MHDELKVAPEEVETPEQPEPTSDSESFPIVAIGASAGGLESLEVFFDATPDDTGMAFVVVTHQSPDHTSLLPELLGKHSKMRSILAADGMKIEPNKIYINPPGFVLTISSGELKLSDLSQKGTPHLPVDIFFRSLAQEYKERAVCIVLSGTASDGTVGLKDIKTAGGLVLAQELSTAKYAGMPKSAIATGLVDFILPPGEMSAAISTYNKNAKSTSTQAEEAFELELKDFGEILNILRRVSGHDFASYKRNMIHRRVARRMVVRNKKTPKEYIAYLEDHPKESSLLMKELLISVTGFFRDPQAYETLAKVALPKMLDAKGPGETIRAWCAGCATGEEAYSLSILLAEAVERSDKQIDLQIFATDLDGEAIDTARRGEYPFGTTLDVSANRLERYFVSSENAYSVKKEIRNKIVFAVQDLIKDPPFTKMDIIFCRNLLIYLDAPLQKRVLSMLHYALKPGGILMLGTSEALSGAEQLFNVVDKKWRIFESKSAPSSYVLPAYPYTAVNPNKHKADSNMSFDDSTKLNFKVLAEAYLAERYAPPSAIVNERGDVFYIHGKIGDILTPAAGVHPNNNILDMARDGLNLPLATVLRRAQDKTGEIILENVKIKSNDKQLVLSLVATKLQSPESLQGLIVVSFCPTNFSLAKNPDAVIETISEEDAERVLDLERELQYTRESLQVRVEELQTANEELQSSNEELQSSNEELETSREELQSLNEELQTVSTEFEGKVDQLSRSRDDMQNLLDSIDVAIVFLDTDLCIRRFTRPATEIIKMIESDLGRPISDLSSNLDYENLYEDAKHVLETLEAKEVKVKAKNGATCLMRIAPYRTSEKAIDGLVITFFDLSKLQIEKE